MSRLSVRDSAWDAVRLPVRPLAGRLAADRLETLVTPDGDLALQFVPETKVARAIHETGRRASGSATTRRAKAVLRRARKALGVATEAEAVRRAIERVAEMEAFWRFMTRTRGRLKPGSFRRP